MAMAVEGDVNTGCEVSGGKFGASKWIPIPNITWNVGEEADS